MKTILDCYTDEPSGLGVPPYIGTYPRYLAGALGRDARYITIDDLRLLMHYKNNVKETPKTNIKIKNLSKSHGELQRILEKTEELLIVAGIQTPGKYLSALPGTIHEIIRLTEPIKCKKVLTGPAGSAQGTRLEGGKFAEKIDLSHFDIVDDNYLDIDDYAKITPDAAIVKQHPDFPNTIVEIETGKGCFGGRCSFCVEPCEKLEFREQKDIVKEIKALYDAGIRHFRLGKQSCFYSYKLGKPEEIEKLLKGIRSSCPEIKVLHIDNANPRMVATEKGEKITRSIVKHCTPGNVAAFGVESFDTTVIRKNNLNSTPEIVLKATETINMYGARRGANGMPLLLPGINILFGLIGESKRTHEENMFWLNKITENNLLRRINIRQVTILDGTQLKEEAGNKFLRKNKRYYWKWKNQIRQEIDFPMLQRLVPKGTMMTDLRTEIHDGNTTFCRQLGTYPLIVGVKERLELNKFVNITVKDHMLRSVVGDIKARSGT